MSRLAGMSEIENSNQRWENSGQHNDLIRQSEATQKRKRVNYKKTWVAPTRNQRYSSAQILSRSHRGRAKR